MSETSANRTKAPQTDEVRNKSRETEEMIFSLFVQHGEDFKSLDSLLSSDQDQHKLDPNLNQKVFRTISGSSFDTSDAGFDDESSFGTEGLKCQVSLFVCKICPNGTYRVS